MVQETSFDVGGQGHKLVELLSGEECAEVIGVFGCTVVEVADYQCSLFKVDKLFQKMCSPEEGLVLRTINGDDVEVLQGDFPKLEEGL